MAFIYFFSFLLSFSFERVFLKRQSGYNECSTSSPTTTPRRPVSPLPVLLSQDYKHWRARCAWTAGLPPACSSRMPRLLSFPVLSFLSSFLPPKQLIYLPAALYLTFFCFGHAMRPAGLQFPDQGWNPCPLHWKRGVLTTGPSGKSLPRFFLNS